MHFKKRNIMVVIHILGYFLIFNFIGISINFVQCQEGQTSDFLKFSHRLLGHTFFSIQGICFEKCKKKCDIRAKCKSVNYFQKYKLCELNDDDRDVISLTKTAGYVYFERDEWTDAGVICGTSTCQGQQSCDDVTESCSVKECVLSPMPSGGVLLGNKVSNESRIITGCSQEYSVLYECIMGVWKTTTPFCFESCKAVNETLSDPTSGLFQMCNPNICVFCDFVPGGGYTYISQTSLRYLTSLSNHYTRSDHVMVRHRLQNGEQKEGKLSVYSAFGDRYNVSILLSNYDGFQRPVQTLQPYIYLGLVPLSFGPVKDTIQGYRMNGTDIHFTNCDGNANNYLVVFADSENSSLTVLELCGCNALESGLSDYSQVVAAGHLLPVDHFYPKLEMHMGGCGTLLKNKFAVPITGLTFGLRSDV